MYIIPLTSAHWILNPWQFAAFPLIMPPWLSHSLILIQAATVAPWLQVSGSVRQASDKSPRFTHCFSSLFVLTPLPTLKLLSMCWLFVYLNRMIKSIAKRQLVKLSLKVWKKSNSNFEFLIWETFCRLFWAWIWQKYKYIKIKMSSVIS